MQPYRPLGPNVSLCTSKRKIRSNRLKTIATDLLISKIDDAVQRKGRSIPELQTEKKQKLCIMEVTSLVLDLDVGQERKLADNFRA